MFTKISSQHQYAVMLFGVLAVHTGSVNGAFDIPTGASSSPLFDAKEFSTKMLLFEEFGTQQMPIFEASSDNVLPSPTNCDSGPHGADLDAFLAKQQTLYPFPFDYSWDHTLSNPWQEQLNNCLGITNTVMDGRPPGVWYAHQRWYEFYPKVYFQSAQAGSRENGGLRDNFQMHGYRVGEFASGGLYHNTAADDPKFDGTTKGIKIKLHPKMPEQKENTVWTFDGTLPPKLLMARYGEPILFRHFNALPIRPGANNDFGIHTITTHEHNGHNPAESDGFTHAYFYPGEFYDYHWPMILAGHDSINQSASDPRAGAPDGHGGIINIPGDYRETMSTHWFHDHMLNYTAQNVYKGNAAMMNYYSAVDRGNEAIRDGVNLRFPSGTALDWGNRDYDVNLMIADKAWDANGQLFFNVFNKDGFLGDRMTVNWQWKPYFDVRARRYRFRILNGSVSRYIKIAVVDDRGKRVPFHMIANDGNIMEHAIRFPNTESQELPSQAIAERYDIIINFKGYEGRKIYFYNLLEHQNGRGPSKIVPLSSILNGSYKADGINGDPAVGKFLEFRVKSYSGKDLSMNPADYVPGKRKMIPKPTFTLDELQHAKHRTFEFGRSSGTDQQPWTVKTDGGRGLTMDPHRISAAPDQGSVEIWHLKNGGDGWSHPVHIHFEEGQILYRGGVAPPSWEKWARKDVYRIGPLPDTLESVDVALRFREFSGSYMEHCHNTQHEDNAMLLRWDVQNPHQPLVIPTPMPGWEGVIYEPDIALPTYKTGDVTAAGTFVLP